MAAENLLKDTQSIIKTCSCFKVLDTYAVMEKNLLQVIDSLQYEKKCLIIDYESKLTSLEKKLLDKKLSENFKLQSLSTEILHQKIINHELQNKLKIVEETQKLPKLRTCSQLALRKPEISSTGPETIHEINTLIKTLHSKISSKLKQSEFRADGDSCEIQNLFKNIWSEIKLMETKIDRQSNSCQD